MAITIKEWKIFADHTEKGLEPPRSPSAAASSAPAVQRIRPKIGKQLLIVRRSLHEKGFGVLDLSLSSFCASHFRTPKGLPPSVKPKSGKRSQANSKSDERSAAHGLDIVGGKFVRFPEGLARLSAPLLCYRRSRGPRKLIVRFFRTWNRKTGQLGRGHT